MKCNKYVIERNKQKTFCKMLNHNLKVYDQVNRKIPDIKHSIQTSFNNAKKINNSTKESYLS